MAADVIRPLQYVEVEPSPALSDIVMSYWGFRVHALPTPDFVHRVWPDGCASLVMGFMKNAPTISIVVGASIVAGAVPVYAGDQYWGIRFRPESGAVSCGRDAKTLRDGRFLAVDVFGEGMHTLIADIQSLIDPDAVARVMDAWLLQRRVHADAIDVLVRRAVQHIVHTDGTCSMQDVADALQVGPRQLQRRFRAATGLTPKEYANIRRARAALKRVALGESSGVLGGWARLAAESGYADQAHLTREWTRLMTVTPTVMSSRLDDIAHDRLVD
ncbi:MAG: helix-turn-helix transcriptional regulator [Gemmatimonadaceae bacterium]